MRRVRIMLVILGAVLLLCGGWWLLTRQDLPQLVSVLVWLAAVVVVHDGLLSAASAVRHRLRHRLRPHSGHQREPDESAS